MGLFERLAIVTILLGLVTAQQEYGAEPQSKMIFVDKTTENLLIVKMRKDENGEEEIASCQLLTEKKEIDEILRSTPYSEVRQTSDEEIQGTIDDCSAAHDRKKETEEDNDGKPDNRPVGTTTSDEGEGTTEGYSGVPVILPGTKWCGAGQRAIQIQDLGFYGDTDQCCRAHDLCNDTLAPGETRNNLTNESSFTKLNCRCDDEFYDCLEKINSVVSNSVGNVYFNILRRGCYSYDHPDGGCKTYRSFLKITCKELGKDTSAPKRWRWVEPKRYKTLPIPGPLTITVDI